MIELELIEMIKKIQSVKAESQEVEVKAAHQGCPKKLYDTLSAFANQDNGGIIIFGLDETKEFEVVGVYDVQDLQKKVNEQCKQMEPVVRPVFTVYSHKDGYVVSAEIPAADITERPCYYSGVGRTKGSYIRSGDSDEPMTDYEIYSYEAFRKKYQDDIRINEKADMSVINEHALRRYIHQITEKNQNLARLPEEDIRRFLNMVVDGRPTLVCTLLFSVYPQMFYPQYTINAMVVPGYDKGTVDQDGSRFTDNRRIEGTIMDMLDQALKFFSINMKVKTIIDPKTGRRADKMEYPLLALREAVLNSLVHRDYSIHTEAMPIEVIMYKDRLEIRNPGGLYGRLTVDQLGKVQPDTRNPVLARALETLGIAENRYSGIPTIQRELRNAGMKEAQFTNARNEFVVTFYNEEWTEISSVRNYFEEIRYEKNHFGENHSEATRPRENHSEGKAGERALLEFCHTPRSRREIADFLGMTTIFYVSKVRIQPLLRAGKLKMTIPEHPKSRNQRFYWTGE